MAPLLIFGAFGLLSYTEAYKARSVVIDANGLIADTLSRQTVPLQASDLIGLQAIARTLTDDTDVAVRVTQVFCESACNSQSDRRLRVSFSKGAGLDELSDSDFLQGALRDALPLIARGDRIVLTETQRVDFPLLNFGMDPALIKAQLAVRVRFAPRLCWESCSQNPLS